MSVSYGQSHGWFKGLDWDLVAARKCTPPWIPSHDAMSIKSSHNAGMPIYDQCIDAKLEVCVLHLALIEIV